jgi:molybdopterin converting factor small subunit
MEILVKTPATFRRPDLQNKKIEVESGKTVQQFMAQVKISPSVVMGAIINDQKVPLTQQLADGDSLSFIPMMSGG